MALLIVFHSATGNVEKLALSIAEGAESQGIEAWLRTPPMPRDSEYLTVTKDELRACQGLALGSPSRFGSMSSHMKAFFETTSDLWLSGAMVDKPAGVFGASSSLHGGNEAVLLGLTLPLLHHGMLVTGIPYTQAGLNQTQGGGTPYGPTTVENETGEPHSHELELAHHLGQRLARLIKVNG